MNSSISTSNSLPVSDAKMRIPHSTQVEIEDVMLKTPQTSWIRHWSKLYSATPHLSGDLAHAERIRDLWLSYGIPSKLVRYDVYQNTPIAASLSLHSRDGSKVQYEASLTEPKLDLDPTSSPANGLPAFHGFSFNGKVTAELVYTNFGTIEDFRHLETRGVSVKGKIVICKYSKIFRGLKVRAAEKYGAVGVIIYSDPQEDGEFTEKNGYKAFPEGPARHPESVQRGSVEFFGVAAGDPTTPGYPSLPGKDTKRQDPYYCIPKIPSLPISFKDAIPFLKALDGYGLGPEDVGGEKGDWRGGLDEVGYFTGPSEVKVTLFNDGKYEYKPIYDVIGTVKGKGEELIVLGNHHDSWCCGAVDPVSGSATMNEVVRGLGNLTSLGWQPERTIILASWDGEEYGLLGSTEWAEDNADLLSKHCVAYINVDGATASGSFLKAEGSPLLGHSLRAAASQVPSPINPSSTIYSDWLTHQHTSTIPHIDVMGSGSDYTVFFDHLGIPSLDMNLFEGQKSVYLYHSNYDSYYWVNKFGDPGFKKHLAVAQLFGVLAVKLADTKIIPFQGVEYAVALEKHSKELKLAVKGKVDTKILDENISSFRKAVEKLDAEAEALKLTEVETLNLNPAAAETQKRIAAINKRYMSIERGFLRKDGGLPGREWFKHMVFAPGLWLGYQGVAFPGVLEALDDGDADGARGWVERIAGAINDLAGEL